MLLTVGGQCVRPNSMNQKKTFLDTKNGHRIQEPRAKHGRAKRREVNQRSMGQHMDTCRSPCVPPSDLKWEKGHKKEARLCQTFTAKEYGDSFLAVLLRPRSVCLGLAFLDFHMWWPCVEDLAMCCNRPQGFVVVRTGPARRLRRPAWSCARQPK